MLGLLVAGEILREDLHPLEDEFEDIKHEFKYYGEVLLLDAGYHGY
jgi:hypothetical protein